MKKSVYKIIIIAAACILIAVCIFVGVDILKSRQISLNQSKDNLEYMSENCAYEVDSIFSNGELLVDNMAAIVENTIVVGDADTKSDVDSCRNIMYGLAKNSKYPVSLYFTFNPEYIIDDIWYVKKLDGKVSDLSANDEAMDEWLKVWRDANSEYYDFYWDTVQEDEKWFSTMYDPDMKWDIVSKTRAVYDKNGLLIGIAGADIYLGDIEAKLDYINKKTGGISAVIDHKDNLIAGSKECFELMDDNAYIYASSDIGSLWTVLLVQPTRKAVGKIYEMIFVTLISGMVILVGLIGVMLIVYNRHGKTIITKFEEKDLLMFNQSRQAQIGEMVGNIAHQLKQPLNGVNMALSNIKEEYSKEVDDDEEFNSRIDRVKSHIGNMSETVDDLMMFLKPQKKPVVFSVIETIENGISMMEERIKLYAINVTVAGEDFYVKGYANELAQCVFNIIDNAMFEMANADHEKIINITVSAGMIQIENNGPHIEKQYLEQLFELYYTTKGQDGTGIGLYLTRTIVEMHFAGTIKCRNTDEGVCFEICIPINESEK